EMSFENHPELFNRVLKFILKPTYFEENNFGLGRDVIRKLEEVDLSKVIYDKDIVYKTFNENKINFLNKIQRYKTLYKCIMQDFTIELNENPTTSDEQLVPIPNAAKRMRVNAVEIKPALEDWQQIFEL